MRRGRPNAGRLVAAIVTALLPAMLLGVSSAQAAGDIHVIRVAGSINPASSDYIQRSIEEAEAADAQAIVIELDTPGRLVSATQDIIQSILNAQVAVVVFVSPQGAWAGSAGTFITMAGHIAAMAPGTSIGAAHPVGIGGGSPGGQRQPTGGEEGEDKGSGGPRDFAGEKAENLLAAFIESIAKERGRNVDWAQQAVRESVAITADEAVELDVIDLVADNRAELLEKIDGRAVEVSGEERTLDVGGARIVEVEMRFFQRVLHVLASPDVAVLLLMAGLLGLYLEFQNPGLIVPGTMGLAALILAMVAMQILPFSWLGLILFFAGLALMVGELFVPAYGLLFGAGLLCMLFGGTMLFDMPEASDLQVSFWPVLVPAVGSFGVFGALVAIAVGRSHGLAQVAGTDELVGMEGSVESPIAEGVQGRVYLRGEYWNAESADRDETFEPGDRAEVVRVEGLKILVRRSRE